MAEQRSYDQLWKDYCNAHEKWRAAEDRMDWAINYILDHRSKGLDPIPEKIIKILQHKHKWFYKNGRDYCFCGEDKPTSEVK